MAKARRSALAAVLALAVGLAAPLAAQSGTRAMRVDYVPMAQGEIAFTAMLRMGKRARFVRYWGEGHVLTSPASIRDMWTRIFAWFDEHLRLPDTP